MSKQDNIKTIKVSFEKARLFRIGAIEYLKKIPEETKFKYALEKVFERTTPLEIKWTDRLADIELDNAATDERGIVQFTIDEQGKRVYSFTKEGLRQRDQDVNKEFKAAGLNEVEPFYTEDLPTDLHESWVNVFTPFVIKDAHKK
jgi:hypothetical protein